MEWMWVMREKEDVFDIESGSLVILFFDMGRIMGRVGLERKGKSLFRIC